jgi:hypothetical protein
VGGEEGGCLVEHGGGGRGGDGDAEGIFGGACPGGRVGGGELVQICH